MYGAGGIEYAKDERVVAYPPFTPVDAFRQYKLGIEGRLAAVRWRNKVVKTDVESVQNGLNCKPMTIGG